MSVVAGLHSVKSRVAVVIVMLLVLIPGRWLLGPLAIALVVMVRVVVLGGRLCWWWRVIG